MRRAIKGYAAQKHAGGSQVNLIGQRYASSPSAAVSEISRNPDRIDTRFNGRFETVDQVAFAYECAVFSVVKGAVITIRIEHRLEGHACKGVSKLTRCLHESGSIVI